MMDKNKPTVDRSKNKLANYLIYEYLREEELQKLTDDEFAVLQEKFKLPCIPCGTYTLELFTENGFDAKGLQGDKTLLQIYRRAMAANVIYLDCFYRYTGVFKLCHALGAANVYDIGCGNQLQSLLLIGYPEMSYTGIDPNIFHDHVDGFKADTAQINELFREFTGSDRIYYVDKAYPYDFTIEPNNIAILLCSLTPSTEEKLKKLAGRLSNDFERIIMTLPLREFAWAGKDIKEIVYKDVELWADPYEKYIKLWKKAMPDYKFYKVSDRNIVFATKVSRDIKKLERKYTIINDCILTGMIDISCDISDV